MASKGITGVAAINMRLAIGAVASQVAATHCADLELILLTTGEPLTLATTGSPTSRFQDVLKCIDEPPTDQAKLDDDCVPWKGK